jgi:HEAT repeat protein
MRRRLQPTAWMLTSGFLVIVFLVKPAAGLKVVTKSAAAKPAPAKTAAPAKATPSKSTPANATRDKLEWLTKLDDGYARAREQGLPVLVRGGATWCGWCRKLDEEIAKPAVQTALSKFVLVYLDIDKAPREAQSLGIGSIPALRMLTPSGRVVASQDGYVQASELLAWLSKNQSKAAVAIPPALTDNRPPDAKAVQQLVAQLTQREPVIREAAIRRLMDHPGLAAVPVARLFAEGGLAARLAAIELLSGWKAPVHDLDPWRPETLTPERLASLQTWAKKIDKSATSAPAELIGEPLAEARRELTRLLQADGDTEAEVVRERLARLGPALLPVVYEQLKQASTDRDRERLTALRYRLAAPASLSLDWPGGLNRLASMDAQTRQRAAEELAQRARADAAPLLRELFSNPDPMVREISLRTLRKVGGDEVSDTLAGLLNDPEPNVRAAVLKQLAEQPSRRMVPKLAEYAAKEKDADLLVHLVRVLRATGGKASLECLISLIGHDAWQVRAEVAEAIGAVLNESSDLTQEARADGFVALVKLVQDSDGFVISRALAGLQNADVKLVLDPLIKAANEHPDLAPQLLEMLAQRAGGQIDVPAQLRKFLKSEHPSIRAAAIVQLCRIVPTGSSDELLAAFKDQSEQVRFAGAKAFLTVVEAYRPASNPREGNVFILQDSPDVDVVIEPSVERRGLLSRLFSGGYSGYSGPVTQPASSQPATMATVVAAEGPRVVRVRTGSSVRTAARPSAAADPAGSESDWLDKFRAGPGRPRWMDQVVQPLEDMLSAKDTELRLTAALGLVPLGKDERAVPLLQQIARSQPAFVGRVSHALGWLPLDKRLALFSELLPLASESSAFAELVRSMAIIPDLKAAPALWNLLGREDAPAGQAQTLLGAMRLLYFGQQYYRPQLKATQRERIVSDLRQYTTAGPEIRHVVALALLLPASRSDAATEGRKIYEDTKASESLRRDALQIVLMGQSQRESVKTAAAALSRPEPQLRDLALTYLSQGKRQLGLLHNRSIALEWGDEEPSPDDVTVDGQPITPTAPAGLTAESVRPLLKSDDAQTRARAGYLLALLKRREGLKPLMEYWQKDARNDPTWTRLVYRAIAALNDDNLTPTVEEIYRGLGHEDWQIREFYWTIRSIQGEQILELRKKIRADVGMDKLK